MTRSFDKIGSGGRGNMSNGIVLQLEKGDVIYLTLDIDCGVYNDDNNRNTFSGFLLFTM